MLSLRFARSGRRNLAFYRVVLTEKSKPCDSGYIKILGWYNPHTKEVSLDKEEILSWIDKGAETSNSVAKLLTAQGVKHKNIKFIPDAPKTKKGKKGEKKPQPQPKTDLPLAEKVEEKTGEAEAPDKKPEETEEKQSVEEEHSINQEQESAPEATTDSDNPKSKK